MRTIYLIAFIALMLPASACSSGPASPPPTTTTSTPPATTTTTPAPPAGPTIGQLADAGKTVFAGHCAKCHGANGQGVTAPTIIGSGEALGKYGTAQGLLAFISTIMPADAPGSLSPDQYSQALCFLLIQNNFATANTPFDASKLASIPVK